MAFTNAALSRWNAGENMPYDCLQINRIASHSAVTTIELRPCLFFRVLNRLYDILEVNPRRHKRTVWLLR